MNQVYYKKSSNKVFEVRWENDKKITIGGLTNFYADAMTVKASFPISKKWFEDCVLIDMPLDECEFLEMDKLGIGFRVKNKI